MPSRTYNTLAVGKPMIAVTEPGSELAQTIEEDNVGWVVAPNQPEKLLETIFEAFSKWDELGEFRERARESALKRYSLNLALERYRKELRDCV